MSFRSGPRHAQHQYPSRPNVGATGPTGPAGPGPTGPTGPIGPAGATGAGNYASFFDLVSDAEPVVNPGAAVGFPNDGPASAGTTITRLSPSTFNLALPGAYEVTWQASITEPGQLQVALNGVGVPETVSGRDTGTLQIVGDTTVRTTLPNTVLSIINPAGNSAALHETATAGGANPVSVTLTIKQVA